MRPSELDEIHAFLDRLSLGSLFDYLGLSADASDGELEAALKARRRWAQGQQANPKYREEALWLIRRHGMLRRILLDERPAYVRAVAERAHARDLEVLSLFIRGTMAGGRLTPESEQAIAHQGEELGLPPELVRRRMEELVRELGVVQGRQAPSPAPAASPADDGFVDHYAVLGVSPDAGPEELEKAHRERYRWARTLKDLGKATEIYAQLDAAWRVLGDAQRRAEYDPRWRRHAGGDPSPSTPGLGLLPPQHERAPGRRDAPLRLPEAGHGTAGPPEPPPIPPGRSLGLSRPARNRKTRLAIAGPDLLRLKVGRRPSSRTISVRRTDRGRAPGSVSSNRDWLEVSPARLDPHAEEQQVLLTVHPKLLPPHPSSAIVTVSTTRGDRATCTVRVERRRFLLEKTVGVLLVVGIAASVSWNSGWSLASLPFVHPPPPAPTHPVLDLVLDPPADAVFLDGLAVGSGRHVHLSEKLPAGTPFTLRATHGGFTDEERTLTLQPGEHRELSISLQLSKPLDFEPDEDSQRGELDPSVVSAAVATDLDGFEACLRPALDRPDLEPELHLLLYVTGTGHVAGVEVQQANFDSKTVMPCIERHLRALSFPIFAADYAAVPYVFRASYDRQPDPTEHDR